MSNQNEEKLSEEKSPEETPEEKSLEKEYSKQTIFLTSFAKDMWGTSGKKLVDSFKKYQPKHQLVVCYENFMYEDKDPRILGYNLNQDLFLSQWITKNADIIPDYLGGKATIESAPAIFENSWNRLASRWFRKIVSMRHVLEEYGDQYTYIIWVDADSYFKKTITDQTILDIFMTRDMIFHLGPKRIKNGLGVESGIIGFKNNKGYNFLRRVIRKFESGSFRQYPKWDDGFVFRKAIEEQILIHQKIPKENWIFCKDLVKNLKNQKKHHVIQYGPFKDYIVHEKGKHKRENIRV